MWKCVVFALNFALEKKCYFHCSIDIDEVSYDYLFTRF